MAYTKQTWVNTVTPLDAEHMNYIEKGIEDAHKALNEIPTTGGIKGDPGVGITKITITEEQASGSSDLICKMTFAMSDGTTQEQYFVVPSGTTPVKGKDYYTQADQESIVQQVIAALGTPVFGRVDADNTIVLTGNLVEGTFTVKYEDAAGGLMDIGVLDFGVSPDVALNLNFGKVDKTTGEISGIGTDVVYLYSDLIEFIDGYDYTVLFKGDCKLSGHLCFWDEDHNYLPDAYLDTVTSQPTQDIEIPITKPSGAKYFRVRCYNYDWDWNGMNADDLSQRPLYIEYINTMVECTRAKA